jgi:Ni/Fe-hydrogenase subunit HybB-like protein
MSGPPAAHGLGAAERDAILKDLAAKLPVRSTGSKRAIWIGCLVIGVAAFAYLIFTEPQRAWGAYAVNTLYWLGIAQGAVVLACAIRLANGRWAGPVMRIAESLSAFLPFGFGLMVLLLGAGIWTYLPWVKHVEPRQAPYLNVPFLYARTLLGLGLLWWLSRDLVRTSLRTDAQLLKNHVAPELKAHYEKLSEGWRGDGEEAIQQRDHLAKRAPQIVFAYAVVYTVMAWDFVMSLTPDWTSTLFGWWFFMGAFLSGIAMTALLSTQLRAQYRLEAYITPHHFWDIGKVAFGFSIFWVYQFWSQYLPIWYANLPEETWWVFLRFEEPWRRLAFTVFGFVFLLPFLGLMNMYTKRNPFWLALFSLIILSGMWMERHILIMPSLNPDKMWVGLPEIGVTLGFLGVFGWAVQGFLSKYPAVKVADVLAGHGGHGH